MITLKIAFSSNQMLIDGEYRTDEMISREVLAAFKAYVNYSQLQSVVAGR